MNLFERIKALYDNAVIVMNKYLLAAYFKPVAIAPPNHSQSDSIVETVQKPETIVIVHNVNIDELNTDVNNIGHNEVPQLLKVLFVFTIAVIVSKKTRLIK